LTTNMETKDTPIEKAETAEKLEAVDATKEAKIASQGEHEATLWEALKTNKKAAMWSAIISLTIIMEGYDIGMMLRIRNS
jgi:MFS transporter, SP family, general alpha glucoside:H+ symporter